MGNLLGKKSHKRPQQPAITEQDRAVLVRRKAHESLREGNRVFCIAIETTARSTEPESTTHRKSTRPGTRSCQATAKEWPERVMESIRYERSSLASGSFQTCTVAATTKENARNAT